LEMLPKMSKPKRKLQPVNKKNWQKDARGEPEGENCPEAKKKKGLHQNVHWGKEDKPSMSKPGKKRPDRFGVEA